MRSCKSGGGSAVLPGSSLLVLAGGNNGTILDEVEAFDGTSMRSLASLPYPVEKNCLVGISDSELISIGGHETGGATSRTHIYNMVTDS